MHYDIKTVDFDSIIKKISKITINIGLQFLTILIEYLLFVDQYHAKKLILY